MDEIATMKQYNQDLFELYLIKRHSTVHRKRKNWFDAWLDWLQDREKLNQIL